MKRTRDNALYYAFGFGALVVGLTLLQNLMDRRTGLSEGKPAPDFSARRLSGERVKLSDLRGKVVLVDFWARWCKPCVKTMPTLARVAERLEGKPFVLLSVNIERAQPKSIGDWLGAKVKRFDVVQDDQGHGQAAYRVRGIPRLVIVDAEGILRDSAAGHGEESLVSAIEKLLPPS